MFKPLQKNFSRSNDRDFHVQQESRDRKENIIPPPVTPPWWVKIQTQVPACIYYFGPFTSKQEARLSQAGYIEDLIQEEAREITIQIEQGYPQTLTIFEDN